jgi:Putative Actinobacterial Holin-X, holin superfamily III
MMPAAPASSPPARVAREARPSLGDVARSAATDLVDLVIAQIKLARLELATDARHAVQRAVGVAAFAIPVVVGYAFAMAAAASFLSGYCGWPLALLAISVLQLVVGVLGIRSCMRALRPMRILGRSTTQAESTVLGALAAVSKPDATVDSHSRAS